MLDRLAMPRRRGLLFLVIASVVLGGWYGWRPVGKAAPRLPDPNGWDDLSAAGASIRGAWPNKGDLARADLAEVRAFLAGNVSALDRMRVGLARECVAPFEDTHAGLDKLIRDQNRIRSLSRLILARGRIEEAEGRIPDASRSFLEALALGQAVTRGSMGLGMVMGSAIQEQVVDQLRKLRDRLPAEECRAILREVEAIERRRVGVDEVEARHHRWVRGAFGPWQGMMLRLSGMEQKGRAAELAMARKADDRAARKVRFLLVELAVHAHFLDRGTWPRSVDALVPDYLASVPIDPTTGGPIDYPRDAEGELTDDLGAIGRPDGEVGEAPR